MILLGYVTTHVLSLLVLLMSSIISKDSIEPMMKDAIRCTRVSGGKDLLKKKLEKQLELNLRDILLIWSSTILGAILAYWFEHGITQYRTGFNMPETYHTFLDPFIFACIFIAGGFVYTLLVVLVLRWFMVRLLASMNVDRL